MTVVGACKEDDENECLIATHFVVSPHPSPGIVGRCKDGTVTSTAAARATAFVQSSHPFLSNTGLARAPLAYPVPGNQCRDVSLRLRRESSFVERRYPLSSLRPLRSTSVVLFWWIDVVVVATLGNYYGGTRSWSCVFFVCGYHKRRILCVCRTSSGGAATAVQCGKRELVLLLVCEGLLFVVVLFRVSVAT